MNASISNRFLPLVFPPFSRNFLFLICYLLPTFTFSDQNRIERNKKTEKQRKIIKTSKTKTKIFKNLKNQKKKCRCKMTVKTDRQKL